MIRWNRNDVTITKAIWLNYAQEKNVYLQVVVPLKVNKTWSHDENDNKHELCGKVKCAFDL